jgi:hypothetical protein
MHAAYPPHIIAASVQSIIGAQVMRQGAKWCEFLSMAFSYRTKNTPARGFHCGLNRAHSQYRPLIGKTVSVTKGHDGIEPVHRFKGAQLGRSQGQLGHIPKKHFRCCVGSLDYLLRFISAQPAQ